MAAGSGFQRTRPRGRAELRPCCRRGRRAPHRLPRRADPAGRPNRSTCVSRRETGERPARGPRAGHRDRAPASIVGPGSAAYEVIRDLVNHLPLMVTPRWVQSKSSPIALDEPARVPGARARTSTRPPVRCSTPAAPDYLSVRRQIMRGFGEAVGRRPRIVPRAGAHARPSRRTGSRLITAVPASIAQCAHRRARARPRRPTTPCCAAWCLRRLLSYREAVHAALRGRAYAPGRRALDRRAADRLPWLPARHTRSTPSAPVAMPSRRAPRAASVAGGHDDRRRQRLLLRGLAVVDARRDGLAGAAARV